MSGKQRIYKQKIASTETLKKVFRAMELIAASRIGKAREKAHRAQPFDEALIKAVSAVAQHTSLDHPITRERNDTKRVAVLAVTSDRGMAGAYSATILRETEQLLEELRERGREPILYVYGRRAQSYFRFRGIEVRQSWLGQSDSPSEEIMAEVTETLVDSFLSTKDDGVAELYIVYTHFKSMVSQEPQVRRMLPLKLVEHDPLGNSPAAVVTVGNSAGLNALYEFEPSAEAVLDRLLKLYMRSRIRTALLQSAASELAARQRAMHTATDNAEDLITNYTRLANTARQAEITQEISEIVSGADALGSN